MRKFVFISKVGDAQAFINAAGITDATQKSAITQLVADLKSYGLWSKFIAVYPLVGGTATTHKYNLVNPVDSDAAFRLTFSGGITHDANGMTGNGTNGYARTYIIPSSVLSLNDCSAFYYSRTNASGGYVDMGSLKSTAPQHRSCQMNARSATDLFGTAQNCDTTDGTSNTDSRGFFGISRLSSTGYSQTIGSTQYPITNTSTTLNSVDIALMALGYTGWTTVAYSPRNLAFAAIGTGLTDTECDDFYTAVQAYQTTLSRNV